VDTARFTAAFGARVARRGSALRISKQEQRMSPAANNLVIIEASNENADSFYVEDPHL
jgi:hypothetical protein